MVLGGMTSCSDNDTVSPDDGVKVRRLTITMTGDAAARQLLTRATLTDDGSTLSAEWTGTEGGRTGDELTYCNLNWPKGDDEIPYYGPLTALSTAETSQLSGNVECAGGDYLAVVYPATTFTTNEDYTISLAGQDGTLTGLAKNYHHIFGKAYVTSVTDDTAEAMVTMKSLLTVCKFSFVEKTTEVAIPVETLIISYGANGYYSSIDTYPQSATVAIGVNKAQDDVHATGVNGSEKLTITCPSGGLNEVYVALLPTQNEASTTYNFKVTNSNGTYTGTAKATLKEGEYVVATGLKLTKQAQQ